MMELLYEITIYGLEAIVAVIFLMDKLTSKHHKVLYMALWLEVLLLVIVFTPSFSMLRIGIYLILEFFFVLLMCEERFRTKAKVVLIKDLTMVGSSAVAYALNLWIGGDAFSVFERCHGENCTYCLLYLLIFSVALSIIIQFTKPRIGVEIFWIIGTQVVVGIGEISAVLAIASTSSVLINSMESWFVLIALICMVAANISIGMLAPYLLQLLSTASSMDHGNELNNMEYKYYEMSVENDKKLMALKHDISNNIQTIYSLVENGENQKGLEMINELKKRYDLVEQMVYCHNPVVNIILSNKKKDAEEKNIEVHIRVKENLENLSITDFDLSTVICNLIDNAIRGCVESNQSHPRMIVEIFSKNQYLIIRVLNSCKVTMDIESTDKIETTKTKSKSHGFGMPIIASVARRYKGDFIVSAGNGLFTATVVMSLKC